MATKDEIRPFSFHAPEGELAELRRRVNATRWPDQEQVTDDSQGVRLAIAQKLARYWATEHDWRKVEARLNALPNFITEISGLDIHFIHVRSKHDNALPMIVTHGWPCSRRAPRVGGGAGQRVGRPRPQQARGLQILECTNNGPPSPPYLAASSCPLLAKADMPKNAIDVAFGGKADMTLC